MKPRLLSLLVATMLLSAALLGCAPAQPAAVPALADAPVQETAETAAEPVTLRIVSAWKDFSALEAVAELFSQRYENCTIEYEYLQDYYTSLEKRLASGEDPIDLFVTTNIQADSALLPYALDLYSDPAIDLSSTFEGLIRNFEFRGDGSQPAQQLYAVPLGAEIRGMYVNKTLLSSLGIAVPTNRAELLEACRVLSENGYIPLQGNPGHFAQQLMYPYVCNLIANAPDYEATYNMVNTREATVSELFRQPMELLYEFVSKGYYNYKYVETEYNMFTDTSNEAYARYFLNIVEHDGAYQKADDVGRIAFMPSTMGVNGTIEKVRSDYHSAIDYEFILSPVGLDGGYAYMSPAHGIAINRNSPRLEWAAKFMSFLFEPETNEVFAIKHAVIPNTADAFAFIGTRFNVAQDHISQLGQVTFDFDFYKLIVESLVEVSKANNPKYMTTDANGAPVLYGFETYMNNLEQRLCGTMPAQ